MIDNTKDALDIFNINMKIFKKRLFSCYVGITHSWFRQLAYWIRASV